MKVTYETNMDILPWTYMSNHIHDASIHGRTNDIEEMSREGADLNDTDEFGNTPLWLAYISGHLDTVFALLELNVDINRRTGSILASDFHRACGWADEVFIDILCNYNADINLIDRKENIVFLIQSKSSRFCLGYGKTPLIYAIEYRTYLSTESNDDELIRLLITKGADINHIDMSGLTPIFYAIYRGLPSIVKILLDNHADYQYENDLGYTPFRYALGCLSYVNPHEEIDLYQRRLTIVEFLLEKLKLNENLHELQYSIIGLIPHIPYLFPLFDFIYYCRIKNEGNFEEFAWNIYEQTQWPCDKFYRNLLIAENLIVFNQNIDYIIYFFQRMFIQNSKQLIIFYLQRVIKDKETINRFNLLLYCSFIDMNGNLSYVQMLKSLLENQRIYLFKQRREIIKTILSLCQQAPIRLLALCRQKIRQNLIYSVDRKLLFENVLSKNLQNYLILDELNIFRNSPTNKQFIFLMKKSING